MKGLADFKEEMKQTCAAELAEIKKEVKQICETEINKTVKQTYAEAAKNAATNPGTTTHVRETPHVNPASATGHNCETHHHDLAIAPQRTRDNRVREIQQRNQEHRTQRRRQDSKFEVVLTAQDADPAIKEKLQQQTHAEITAKLQQTVNCQVKENPPQIPGITKLTKSQDIRINLPTEQEAEILRSLKWDKYYKGIAVRQTKYGIVVPGISTKSIDPNNLDNPELAKQLEDQNERIGLKILEMKLLQRKLEVNAQKFSLVILVSQPDMANRGIKQGIYYNYERFPNVERYSPQLQLIQCYHCTRLGHHASKCRSPHPVCAKCSEHHPTSECQSEIYKCSLCKGDHPALTPKCPAKDIERSHLATRKRNTPAHFDEQ
jgi:hypothetical protein